MTAQEGPPGGQPETANPLSSIIQAIRDRGPDALDVHGIPDIEALDLTDIAYVWPNSNSHKGNIHGDTLFPPQAPPESAFLPVPPGAEIDTVTLRMKTGADDKPHTVFIDASGTLKLECPSDAQLIDRWLHKNHLSTAPIEALRSLVACFFAAFTILLPEPVESPITSNRTHSQTRPSPPLWLGAHPI